MTTLRERFDAKWKLDPATGCWLWTAALNERGYGLIQVGTRAAPDCWLAHRVAWTLYVGPIPDGMCVLHHCDRPACVRALGCLWLGTNADNMRDMAIKGRSGSTQHPESRPRGEAHPRTTLSNADVLAIRTSDASTRALARVHGVSRQTIGNVRARRTWSHVA